MSLFGKKSILPLEVDLHSHLIPGIDDGSQSLEQSLSMIRSLKEMGFNKIITTPHIHPRYPNTAEDIMSGLNRLQREIVSAEIPIELEAAAEYYVDETFYEKIKDDDQILFFGDKYVLVESSFINKPAFFESVMFDLQGKGYKPVLAHPERYQFLEGSIEWLEELKATGVLFQVTLGSMGGYYGKKPLQISKQLLARGMVDFLGSDLHRESHLPHLSKGLESKEIQRLIKSGQLKNSQLL